MKQRTIMETLRALQDSIWEKQTRLTPSGFVTRALEIAVRLGASQYLVLGSTPVFDVHAPPPWANGLRVFLPDSLSQLDPDFDSTAVSFCDWMELPCRLDRTSFAQLLGELRIRIPQGSSLVFDFASAYSYEDMEGLLSQHGFLIYEHYTPKEGTNLCLAVRHR